MKFKNVVIESQINKINENLKTILFFLDFAVKQKFDYEITITDLIRTQPEQDFIYKDIAEYNKKPWHSVHQYGRGADIRINDMPQECLRFIISLLKSIPYGDGIHKTILVHDIGNGNHIHIQVKER